MSQRKDFYHPERPFICEDWLIDQTKRQGRTGANVNWIQGEIPGADNTYCCGANLWCKLFCLNHIIISPAAGKETVQPATCHSTWLKHPVVTPPVSLCCCKINASIQSKRRNVFCFYSLMPMCFVDFSLEQREKRKSCDSNPKLPQ